MLRTWQDVTAKWRLAPDEGPNDHRDGRSALLSGDLDTALAAFGRAAAGRAHPHDHVGLGDVALARGRVRSAVTEYRAALDLDPDDRLALLGLSQARVAGGDAEAVADELEAAFGAAGADPVLRYYLASTWCSAADQVRDRTAEDVLVFTDEHQLEVCEHAALRILELEVDDDELNRVAERLLSEVRAGRRYQWRPEGIAVSLAVLAVSIGLTLVAVGGAAGSVPAVLAGIVLGSVLLYVIIVRFRRQRWRLTQVRRGG
ncbi:tetratricopeptide repeat protein [Actinokineospora sp. G85]|uniref:tetratricopeptide repeat protein n=1 Tax=Actinokineospora sp. G85 TaxID=3406626 RepID=UPI003C78C413